MSDRILAHALYTGLPLGGVAKIAIENMSRAFENGEINLRPEADGDSWLLGGSGLRMQKLRGTSLAPRQDHVAVIRPQVGRVSREERVYSSVSTDVRDSAGDRRQTSTMVTSVQTKLGARRPLN